MFKFMRPKPISPPSITTGEPGSDNRSLEMFEQRFHEVEKQFASSDKRIDDMKGYFAGAAGIITVWFSVLTIALSINVSDEKASLREFQQDMREDLLKNPPIPQVDLLGVDGKPLAGQTVI